MHWVLLDAPVATTLTQAHADPSRGLSRTAGFHHEQHERFRRLRDGIPAGHTFNTAVTDAATIAEHVLRILKTR